MEIINLQFIHHRCTTDPSNEDSRALQTLEEFSAISHSRVASQSLCKRVAHVKTVGSVARACPYSQKSRIMLALCLMLRSMYYSRYYAGINLRKPTMYYTSMCNI